VQKIPSKVNAKKYYKMSILDEFNFLRRNGSNCVINNNISTYKCFASSLPNTPSIFLLNSATIIQLNNNYNKRIYE